MSDFVAVTKPELIVIQCHKNYKICLKYFSLLLISYRARRANRSYSEGAKSDLTIPIWTQPTILHISCYIIFCLRFRFAWWYHLILFLSVTCAMFDIQRLWWQCGWWQEYEWSRNSHQSQAQTIPVFFASFRNRLEILINHKHKQFPFFVASFRNRLEIPTNHKHKQFPFCLPLSEID